MPSHWHMVVMLVALHGLLKKRFFNTSFTAAGPLLLFKSSQRFEVEKLSTIPPENFGQDREYGKEAGRISRRLRLWGLRFCHQVSPQR